MRRVDWEPASDDRSGVRRDKATPRSLPGMAWRYRQYAKEQTAEDQGRYQSAENEARLRRWGLWRRSAASAAVGRRDWEKRQAAIADGGVDSDSGMRLPVHYPS